MNADLESLDLRQRVGLDDLPHVGLGVHQHEGQLGRQLAADRAEEQLHLQLNRCDGSEKSYHIHFPIYDHVLYSKLALTVYEMTMPKMSLLFSSASRVEEASSVSAPEGFTGLET